MKPILNKVGHNAGVAITKCLWCVTPFAIACVALLTLPENPAVTRVMDAIYNSDKTGTSTRVSPPEAPIVDNSFGCGGFGLGK